MSFFTIVQNDSLEGVTLVDPASTHETMDRFESR